ncbi:hypothetical protein VTJ49DRAFT_1706 [Mycothermus thermophilus]|uniref:Integral membrane protein TmpA n=1 Tax=Humicola insolens TaxID=85995 RepID=A0ABR3VBL0_HUMIN
MDSSSASVPVTRGMPDSPDTPVPSEVEARTPRSRSPDSSTTSEKVPRTSSQDVTRSSDKTSTRSTSPASTPSSRPNSRSSSSERSSTIDGTDSHSGTTVTLASQTTPSVTKKESPTALSEKPVLDIEAQDVDDFSRKRLGFVRYMALNVYRRLFSIAFIANVVAFCVILANGPQPMDLVNAAAVNLAVCGLCRQPLVINGLYLLFGSVPRSAPMRLRRLACKIFHFGGMHSGAGVASVVWYVGFAVLHTSRYKLGSPAAATAALALVWVVLVLLLAIVAVAHPSFRARHHDVFELTHRFANWMVLAFLWALIFLLGSQERSLGAFLVRLPAFWILILLTLATLHPWLLLRRVPVSAEPLSAHAVRLHFSHATIRFGQGISIARHPLADWHAFASFPDRHDSPETNFSVLVSRAGDWTGGIIAAPPTKVWTRGLPTYGFGYVMRMFERIVVVTTGSGIGPCLSFLADRHRPAIRVVWQTKSPLRTYGPRTLALVRRMDEKAVIIDTSVQGRVDMLPAVLALYKESRAEAVCVISNPVMTKRLVYQLETMGIAAYGPIFDS